MDWTVKVFAYCERGFDAGFWAEPLNAASNAAFLLAAASAFLAWRAQPAMHRGWSELTLIGVVAVVGMGSFLFHTFATRWAIMADVLPITIFMLAYLGYALRRFVRLGRLATGIGLALFMVALKAGEDANCGQGPCLNGSVGYVPALVALALIGAWLMAQGHAAGPPLVIGAAVFAVSVTLRTIDRDVCPSTTILGAGPLGTHFLWHILNAILLAILLLAAIRHGRPAAPAAAIAEATGSSA
jgi:hypothetical protein